MVNFLPTLSIPQQAALGLLVTTISSYFSAKRMKVDMLRVLIVSVSLNLILHILFGLKTPLYTVLFG